MLKMEAALPTLARLAKLRMLSWLKALRVLRGLLKLSHPAVVPILLGALLGRAQDRLKREAAYLPRIIAPSIFLLICVFSPPVGSIFPA
jgi:hypothetical protein